jgi:hypothetical protein
MADVFISYKQDERDRMRPLAAGLRALKVEVWFDERLSPDKPFTEEIEDVANTCGAQLVWWSPAAVKSEWVRGEAEVGRQRGTLVQAMIEPCVLSPPFNVIHAENISDWRGQPEHAGWQKLLDTIGRKIGRPGLAELAMIQGSPISEDWKKWATKFPSDPCADEAWQKAQDLHLNEERGRMAKEWQATRKKAEDEETRRRASEEARRRTPPPTAPNAHPDARYVLENPKRGNPAAMIVGGLVAIGLIAGGVWYFVPHVGASAGPVQNALDPGVASFANELQGRWRIEGQSDCRSPYVLSISGSTLSLVGPDGSPQQEQITGIEQGWLKTNGASNVSSYYQRRGRVLAYRYSNIDDDAGESRFQHCE